MSDVAYYTEELAADCGYDEDEDTGIDSMIDYKNALEETVNAVEAALRAREGVSLSDWLEAQRREGFAS